VSYAGWWCLVGGLWQAVSVEVEKSKKSVLECVELADQLQSSPICSEVARVCLHKQVRDLETLAANVEDDWLRRQTELETRLAHLEKFYASYEVCSRMNTG